MDEDTIYYFSTSETIPENVTLEVESGAVIDVTDCTLTINGPFRAIPDHCITLHGTGVVNFGKGSVEKLNVLWWGANPNGAETSTTTAALQAAIDCSISSWSTYTYNAEDYSLPIEIPLGNYLINSQLIITENQGLSIIGDGSSSCNSTIQWNGNDVTDPNYFMIDARSCLSFKLRNLNFIGQSDLSDANSNCVQNGIISRRHGGGIFNSWNSWKDIKIYRFPGIGLQFGDYEGYDDANSVYPDYTSQTDNSYFENIVIQDCRTGLVLNTPMFLQTFFNKLTVFNYGGNPVDANSVPIESGSAAPIKFRTQNGIKILYGEFQGSDVAVYASYCDPNVAYSQYAIYCLDGTFNILNGYSEARFLAYVDNEAGGSQVKNINSISNYHLFPGAAGGPSTSGKYPIYYAHRNRPLNLIGTRKVYVVEDSNSAGVFAFGCQTETPYMSIVDSTNKVRNSKSMDIACTYMTYDSGYRWATSNFVGNWGNLVEEDGSFMFLKGLLSRNSVAGKQYLFYPGDPNNEGTIACGIIIDPNETSLKWFHKTCVSGSSYTKAQLEAEATTLKRDNYFYDSVGTDSYAVNPSPAYTEYFRGMDIIFYANDENIGPCTLNVNGLGAKSIKTAINRDLYDSYIGDGSLVHVVYDGTNFQILNKPEYARNRYPSYNAADHGLSGNSDTIKYAHDVIQAASGPGKIILRCTSGQASTLYTMNTDETITSDVTLEIESGAYIDGNATLTINGPFKANLSKCFGSSITVVFGDDAVRQKYPEWDASTPDQYTELDGGLSFGSIATFTSTDTDPSVQNGIIFKTNNGSSTTIDDFDDGAIGQVIKVIINDTNTTIDFTSSGLKGNGGADWSPTTNDWMECLYDGTDWFCSVTGGGGGGSDTIGWSYTEESSVPGSPVDHKIYWSDGSSWDPLSLSKPAAYLYEDTNTRWIGIIDKDGNALFDSIDQDVITVTTGDNYTNFGDADDNEIDELFDAVDTALGGVSDKKEIGWKVYDSDDVSAVGDGKQAAVIPSSMNGMNLTDVTCSIADQNSASSGTTTVVLRRVRAGTPQNMTSVGVTISYNEYTASDETVDGSYDDVQTGDSIYVDIDAITSPAHKGLSCTAVFETP
jgi:hypothetical protein